MAWPRITRSSLKQTRRAIGNCISEKSALGQEGASSSKCYSTAALKDITLSSNLKSVSTVGSMDRMDFWYRGIKATPHYQFQSAERVIEDSDLEHDDDTRLPGLDATKPGEKPRVVVIGTGWASCRFLKGLDTSIHDIVCISSRNHMVFTPLLASTCVGTLEFCLVAEPVSRIQSALATAPNSYFYLANYMRIDPAKHEVVHHLAMMDHLMSSPIDLELHMTS